MRMYACSALALLCSASGALAQADGAPPQTNSDGYRAAYRSWRETDPSLEASSASGGQAIAPRAARVAAGAAKYGAARSAYLDAVADQLEQQLLWLQNSATPQGAPFGSAKREQDSVAAASAVTARAITTLADDRDPGIAPLRQALARESAALAALTPALDDQEKSAGAVEAAAKAEEAARLKALDAYRPLVGGAKQMAEQTRRETAAWAAYYGKLSDAARAVTPPVAPPLATTTLNLPPPRPASTSPATPAIARYAGQWFFPATGGLYHGSQPETVDLTVREDNGHASGFLLARFRVPQGSNQDPVIRFEFSGDFTNARSQVFGLETNAGAKGTIELIPGTAFNLLEVNFVTDALAGKVRQGNFLLIRK